MDKQRAINLSILVLTIEKALQHLLVAFFFIVDVPGIGTPDIGSFFDISNPVMAFLNLIYFFSFLIGIVGKIRNKKWAMGLIIFLASLDIILEFLFHGFFFITVSVIVSTVLVIVSVYYLKNQPARNKSS